jgi:hypothetical protein
LTVKGTGTATAGITVTAYGTGAVPSIADTSTSDAGAVDLSGPYITLKNVAITAAPQYGVRANAVHDSIVDVDISNVGNGLVARAAYMVADRVSVHDLHMIVNTPGGDDDYGAVGFDIHSTNATVENSSCTNCIAPSYDYGQDGGFVEIYNSGDNLYVYNNVATNTDGFMEAGASSSTATADNVTILGNTMTNVRCAFYIHSGTTDAFAISTKNLLIAANTITNSSTNSILGGYLGSIDFENNVVTNNGHIAGSTPFKHTGNHYKVGNGAAVGFPLDPSETATFSALPVA